MTVGLAAVNVANKILDAMRGASSVAFGPFTTLFVQLHTNVGDPGASGTANVSANTTRVAVNEAAASAGAQAMTGTQPSWASWASGAETIAHISVWSASTAGTFLYSVTLTAPKAVANGDTLTLTSLSVSFAPLAA